MQKPHWGTPVADEGVLERVSTPFCASPSMVRDRAVRAPAWPARGSSPRACRRGGRCRRRSRRCRSLPWARSGSGPRAAHPAASRTAGRAPPPPRRSPYSSGLASPRDGSLSRSSGARASERRGERAAGQDANEVAAEVGGAALVARSGARRSTASSAARSISCGRDRLALQRLLGGGGAERARAPPPRARSAPCVQTPFDSVSCDATPTTAMSSSRRGVCRR